MRKLFAPGVVVATALALLAPIVTAAPAQAATNTVVSLTFAGGLASQSIAETQLDAHGMHGTFYVNANRIDQAGYLTWTQLTQFAAAGHEIGGHTLDHLNLTTIPVGQAQYQVCQDRAQLMNHGLSVTDFAYPYGFGYATDAVRAVVQGCGYNSALRAWGLYSARPECGTTGCGYPYASTIPPGDPLGVPAADNPQANTTLAQIEQLVTQAETNGGGLVPITFQEICTGCATYSTDQATLQAFLDWLAPRAASGTTVKTMAEVIGGAVQPSPGLDTTAPVSTIACNGVACSAAWYTAAVQVSLSATDAGSGIAAIRYTTDGTDPTPTSPLYSGPFGVAATTTVKYAAWDYAGNQEVAKAQLIQVDTVAPVSSIACNGAACSSAPYAAPAQVTLSATDTGGSGLAAIRFTTDGSDPTLASPVYSAPFPVSVTTTVKYRAWDNAGIAEATNSRVVGIDTNAPTSAMACNAAACGGGWYNAPVQVSLSATDTGGAGVAAIRYTTDGSTPTLASAAYSVPFTVSNSTTVKYRAWDNVGNIEPINTQAIQFDNVAPISSIACNGLSCSGGWYSAPVQVLLAAGDTGGAGVAAIHYTTDGSVPTLASPAYVAPFSVSLTTTVTYRAWDNAGNQEAAKSQLIRADTVAPVSAIKCNGAACSGGWYTAAVHVSLSSVDSGGSGVAAVRYTTDGSDPTLASPVYGAPFTVSASKRVNYRAWDNAGNVGPVQSQLVRIDIAKPTVAITSPANRAGRANRALTGIVKIVVTATDSQSGIARVRFYVDRKLVATDTTPVYSFVWNTTQVRKGAHTLTARAFDGAGNSTAQSITVTVQ